MRMLIRGQDLGVRGGQGFDPAGADGVPRELEPGSRYRAQRHGFQEVAELVVVHPCHPGEAGGCQLVARTSFFVGVRGAWAEDEMAAGSRVVGEPVDRRIVDEVEAWHDQLDLDPGPPPRERHPRATRRSRTYRGLTIG